MSDELRERYGYLGDLQAECKSLVVGKSIKLTGMVMDNDAIESSILLLELIKKIEDSHEPKTRDSRAVGSENRRALSWRWSSVGKICTM